jgi:hypothetical protein
MKDKIIQIIKGYECDAYFGANLNHLKESDYENVAEDIVKLFLIPPVIGSLPCNHNYNQVDTYWNRCTHCGMYAPLGQ